MNSVRWATVGLVVDEAKAEHAVAELLEALGFDPASERLQRTPARAVSALAALTATEPLEPVSLQPAEGYEGPIVMRDIPFHALCEHHLLPFRGVAHIGYVPGSGLAGLSTLARVVEHHARGLQVQERMTAQIADALERELSPVGLVVVLDAEHLCMSLRNIALPTTRTMTRELRGDPTGLTELLP